MESEEIGPKLVTISNPFRVGLKNNSNLSIDSGRNREKQWQKSKAMEKHYVASLWFCCSFQIYLSLKSFFGYKNQILYIESHCSA